MKKLFLFIFALVWLVSPVTAQTPFSGSLLPAVAAASYVGPGDIQAFKFWYGLRGYSAAAAASGTTKMVRLLKISSSEQCDILVASNGSFGLTTNCTGASGGVSTSTFCAGTDAACSVAKMYDQTGNNGCGGSACDMAQASAGSQPLFYFLSTTQFTYGSFNIGVTSANSFTPASAVLSIVTVAKRTGIGGAVLYFQRNFGTSNSLNDSSGGSNTWTLTGGSSGTIAATAASSVWHAGIGIFNGASSSLMIDGVSTTGTVVAATTAAAPTVTGNSLGAVPGNYRESGVVDGAISAGNQTALNANMRAYWGI